MNKRYGALIEASLNKDKINILCAGNIALENCIVLEVTPEEVVLIVPEYRTTETAQSDQVVVEAVLLEVILALDLIKGIALTRASIEERS